MNYTRIYKQLIRKARSRVLVDCYAEKHHIVPKCLGGHNGLDNLVKLTAREHYIAHLLLVKITEKLPTRKNGYYKLLWALNMMLVKSSDHNREFKFDSKLYASLKGKFRHTEETKAKMSIASKGRRLSKKQKNKISKTRKYRIAKGLIEKPIGAKNGMYGKKLSKETRQKLSNIRTGRKDSDETRRKKSIAFSGKGNGMYGRKLSKEHRKILSEANKGREQSKEHVRKRTKNNIGKVHINNGLRNKFVHEQDFIGKWMQLGYSRGMKKRVKK